MGFALVRLLRILIRTGQPFLCLNTAYLHAARATPSPIPIPGAEEIMDQEPFYFMVFLCKVVWRWRNG